MLIYLFSQLFAVLSVRRGDLLMSKADRPRPRRARRLAVEHALLTYVWLGR